jgi:hypothetical protein
MMICKKKGHKKIIHIKSHLIKRHYSSIHAAKILSSNYEYCPFFRTTNSRRTEVRIKTKCLHKRIKDQDCVLINLGTMSI